MVPLAIGTQTIGSVVRPAAYCGVVGFKPSYGRIPVSGVIANAPSFDTVGVFAADVAGVAVLAGVLCDLWRPAAVPGRPIIGIPSGPYLRHAGTEALAAFAGQVELLRAAGFTVRDIPVMADFDVVAADSFVMNRYEVARTHSRWFAEFGSLYRPETVQAIKQGQLLDAADYEKALAARERFRGEFVPGMPVDLWIAPAATGPAPYSLDTTGDSVMCLPWSYIGLPSISLPAGRAGNGLPLGLQCVGRPGADEMLLSWASDIEAALPWVSPPPRGDHAEKARDTP
jgi:Asp-tRNA(Asn)/Glu-tRNA(Gln) amidotransferase A subunit family amidase